MQRTKSALVSMVAVFAAGTTGRSSSNPTRPTICLWWSRLIRSSDRIMKETYLEVTYRRGHAVAAYYYLPRRPDDRSHKTRRIEPGFVIDFARDGRAIGIEITAPTRLSVTALNKVLRELGFPLVTKADLAPVLAAA
jgi:hypothetical protein